jgi:hypothetical protein
MMLDLIIQHHPTRFAQNAFYADGLKEVLTPNQREVDMRSRALFYLITLSNYQDYQEPCTRPVRTVL